MILDIIRYAALGLAIVFVLALAVCAFAPLFEKRGIVVRCEARPNAARPWVWEAWDITHPAECNHFRFATFDSNGAGDDFHELHARIFCAAVAKATD